mmetsp:Transcript_14938/g.29051  ORF Transcript_14938/g.29051 Transcript_14938/m.29051 type:complete len:298 (+) Transcript_14938:101-994(+)
MDALISWLAENCDSEKLKKHWTEDACVDMVPDPSSGYGDRVLRSTGKLRRNLRLPVPPACILTMDKIETSRVGQALRGLDRYTLFAVFLVHEKRCGDASFWKPYLDILPQNMQFHPITFLDRQRTCQALADALQKEKLLLRALEAQQEKLRGEFSRAQQLLSLHSIKDMPELCLAFPVDQPLTYEEFIWASSMVVSRAFNMVEPKIMCMLPFADSMNHNAANPTVQWRPKLPKGFFVVTIMQDLEPGAELTANYHGENSSSKASKSDMDDLRNFVMYGFVETDAFAEVRKAALLDEK